MAFNNFPQGPGSAPRVSEVADFSSADHDFTANTDYPAGAAKGLEITVTNSSGGTLNLRLLGDSADRSFTFAAGSHYRFWHVSHIRNSGTSNIAQVVGFLS